MRRSIFSRNGGAGRAAVRRTPVVFAAVMIGMAAPVLAAPAGPAGSRARTPILVLEAYTGGRPGEIAPLVETLNEELEQRGFAAHATTVLKVAAGLPRPGLMDKGVTAARIALDVDNGYDLFTQGTKQSYRKAIEVLKRAIEIIRRNPALIVLNTSNIDFVRKAYLTLALCQANVGSAEWIVTMLEEIRMFPTRPFPPSDYGPDDEKKFYKPAYKQAQVLGRGKLRIAAGNSQAVLFVDGQIRGIDHVELADLIAGTYQVFVQVPGTPGRQYEVEVVANDDTYLNVEPDNDCPLWASDVWVGFQFSTAAARGQEAKCAGRIATRWSGRDLVGVVGAQMRDRRLVLTGTIYTADGTMLRSMALDVLTATPVLLRQLAQLMAEGGAPPDGITLIAGARAAPAVSEYQADSAGGHWWSKPSTYLIGGGALTILGGAAVYVRSPFDQRNPLADGTDGRNPVVGVMLGGSLVLGGGVYLWSRESLSAGRLTAGAFGLGVASVAAGAQLYLTSQDPEPGLPKYIRNSSTRGVVAGIVGLSLIGTGVWLLRDQRSTDASARAAVARRPAAIASWAPFASAGSDQALLGLVGSY
jgi:hypothetical protein